MMINRRRWCAVGVACTAVFWSVWGIADPAPVVDLSGEGVSETAPSSVASPMASPSAPSSVAQSADTGGAQEYVAADTSSMSVDQKISQLQNQVTFLTKMNVSQQLGEVKQQMQAMKGQLDKQQHELQILHMEQQKFYQDVDQRLQKIQKGEAGVMPKVSTMPEASKDKLAYTTQADWTAYQKGFQQLVQSRYSIARDSFTAYLKDYPTGRYRANAHYWLGDIAYSKKDYKSALMAFQKIVSDFPQSQKVPDARLKMGMTYLGLGEQEKARQAFVYVKDHYAGTTAAQLATVQLDQMSLS